MGIIGNAGAEAVVAMIIILLGLILIVNLGNGGNKK